MAGFAKGGAVVQLADSGHGTLMTYEVKADVGGKLDANTLVTTPNSDVIYAMSYLDLGKDGPMVFEAPPKLQGILLDFWQRPIQGPKIGGRDFKGDVGFFGPDAGNGGKFLILPPGYDKKVPAGYFTYRSRTNSPTRPVWR